MLEVCEVRARPDRLQTGQVSGDEYSVLPPLGFANGLDACMRMWAAQKGCVQHARQHDVRHILAAAMQETVVLAPPDARADATLSAVRHNAHVPLRRHYSKPRNLLANCGSPVKDALSPSRIVRPFSMT